MKVFRIKMFRKFPIRSAKDKVIRTVDNVKSARLISINLNQHSENRYYVEELEVL